ncbi:DUF6668 family protein [Nocardiopsis terrae]
MWWYGVHGGAGESTLAEIGHGRAAEHRWPQTAPQEPEPHVVLVARTHHAGLMRAQQAAIEWASGQVRAQVIGLVLVPDAPGRCPRPLQELVTMIAGGLPRTWHLPWVRAWRSAPASTQTTPGAVARVLRAVAEARADGVSPSPVSPVN